MKFQSVVLPISVMTFALPFLLLGCQAFQKSTRPTSSANSGAVTAEENLDLTWKEAQSRSSRVSNAKYALSVVLNEKDTSFTGQQRIEFQLSDASTPLRVDFFEGKIGSMILNDKPLDATAKKRYWIMLPPSQLQKGRNVLIVPYTQDYSRQGQGLHRFVDPESKEVFLYSQFETFDANRFMPCFDQPDLKATLDLEVTAPPDWQVVSTTASVEETMLAPDRQYWKFATTPKISTYLFSLHAGPYQVWTEDDQGMKLRLFARPSMAKFVPVQKWFQITKQGLKFFNHYYAFPYPFQKYDQLIVPEFNAGAMENVGAVTFTEASLSRSPLRRDQWRRTSSTILHEMAHMWFGNIVTMKWWNDLWLNESFATFMASLALNAATDFKETWQDFFAGSKSGAYWLDSLSSTHPIEAPVKTVKQAFANFDSITYGKGAAVLKQLSHYIGPDKFQKGVQVYLKRHAYGNSELKDFIAALQEQTPKDLNLWADRWLRQSGVDALEARWTCDGTRLKKLNLAVLPTPNTSFRPQAISVSLHKTKAGRLELTQRFDVSLNQPETTVTGDWECPDFVYPNDQDHGYLHVHLDAKSLATLKSRLSDLQDLTLRTQVWNDLWRMVRYEQMPLKDYVEIVDRHFSKESNEIILREIVSKVSGRSGDRGTVLYYWATEPAQVAAARDRFLARLESEYLRRFKESKPGSDLQKFWFDSALHVSRSPAAVARFQKWFDEPLIGPGFPWDLDRQWAVVHKLSRFKSAQAQPALEKMKKKDLSERGRKAAMAVDAIRPDMEMKKKWVSQLTVPKPALSFSEARSVLSSLFPVEQMALARHFKEDFYSYLKQQGRAEDITSPEAVVSALSPLFCNKVDSDELRSFLVREKDFDPSIEKNLAIALEEDERCQRVR